MWKIFEKIRETIFGERDAIELGNLTLKNKKLTPNEKLTKILTDYGKYYKYKHDDAVDLMTWELHYEDFMIDGKVKHKLRFEKFYDACEDQINYVNTVALVRQIKALTDVDYSKCTKTELAVVECAVDLSKVYTNDYDYEGFYVNREQREESAEKNETIIDRVKANYESIIKTQDAGIEK